MEASLFEEIFNRLDAANLSPEIADTVLAACDSEQTLETLLNDAGFVTPKRPAVVAEVPEAKGAYLTSVSVKGFRGIGNEVTMKLCPGPGLTVIAGRNGSGKSSIAEGIEVLLTGAMRRLEDKPVVWKSGWRNLHRSGSPELRATLTVDYAKQPTEVKRTWGPGESDLEASAATVQEHGKPRQPYAELGWESGLGQFRPILAHAELESFFGSPAQLHYLLASVLGLDELEKVLTLLSQARRVSDRDVKSSKAALPPILEALRAVDDERAIKCTTLLSSTKPDLAAVHAIASGTAAPQLGGSLDWLQQLTVIALPTETMMSAACAALEMAISDENALKGTDASEADQTAQVLRAALAHYESHGSGPCPVCGTEGKLDEAWAGATRDLAKKLEESAAAVRSATAKLSFAAGAAKRLVQSAPLCLTDPKDSTPDPTPSVAAWASWCSEDLDALHPSRLLEHLKTTWPPLSAAVIDLKSAAEVALKAKQDAWTPVAIEVQQWCDNEKRVRGRATHVSHIRAAEQWLKEENQELLNDRLEPIKDAALHYWDMLRQGSDVTLTKIRLEGTRNRRTVEFEVEVDGSAGAALGVMSQGEVNALALSVFIPRATAPESPFRFLIIDDPIQAMDPSKVDGLARVLAEVATSRQVLVFTHDHRLTDAVRRLGVDATILNVTRKPKSEVDVATVLDPARRTIDEAEHVALDENLADEVKRRVVGGMCRLAIEAHLVEMARTRLFKAGHTVSEVDAAVQAADSTNKKAALGLFGDVKRTADVLGALANVHAWVPRYFTKVRDSAHIGVGDDIPKFLRDARDFVRVVQ